MYFPVQQKFISHVLTKHISSTLTSQNSVIHQNIMISFLLITSPLSSTWAHASHGEVSGVGKIHWAKWLQNCKSEENGSVRLYQIPHQYGHHPGELAFCQCFFCWGRVACNSRWIVCAHSVLRFCYFKVEKSCLDAWKAGKLCCLQWLYTKMFKTCTASVNTLSIFLIKHFCRDRTKHYEAWMQYY